MNKPRLISSDALFVQESLPERPRSSLKIGMHRLSPWTEELKSRVEQNAGCRMTLLIPAKGAGSRIASTLHEAHAYLEARYPGDFEILVIPNPDPWDPESHSADETLRYAREAAEKLANVTVVAHLFPSGKGAALRSAMAHSQGRSVYFTDADLPYDLHFIEQSLPRLESGEIHLAYGNRRLPESRFDLPVSVLPYVYSRHRLSLIFNRVVRQILKIPVRDTQAGIKGLSRALATECFSRLECPGFFFDLELFLTALHHPRFHGKWGLLELPVTLHLESEKSTVRVLREAMLAWVWILRIARRRRRQGYGNARRLSSSKLLQLYKEAGWFERLFLLARWSLTPYGEIVQALPKQGLVLDVGSGHGLLSLQIASCDLEREKSGDKSMAGTPLRTVLGLDHDQSRVRLAASALSKVYPQLSFLKIGLQEYLSGAEGAKKTSTVEAITAIDVLHYFTPPEQEEFFRLAYAALKPGGVLIFREVGKASNFVSRCNQAYERFATKVGFTQDNAHVHHFRSSEEWAKLAERTGFSVKYDSCSNPFFADILFLATKRPDLEQQGFSRANLERARGDRQQTESP